MPARSKTAQPRRRAAPRRAGAGSASPPKYKTRSRSGLPFALSPGERASRPPAGLIAAALKARERAVAPYSNFKVGAALLTQAGEIITGANVESASYGLTCCAERVALFHALTSGKRNFVAVAVVAQAPGGAMPCGACRQLLAEYAPEARLWVADSAAPRQSRSFSVRELLPAAFSDFRPQR